MPMPRRKRDRLHQVKNWAVDKYPPPYPVDLRVERIPKESGEPLCCGGMYFSDKRFTIRVSPRLPWTTAIDTLLHELGHCLVWTFAHVEENRPHHPREFWLAHGDMYSDFHDGTGWKDSREYPW